MFVSAKRIVPPNDGAGPVGPIHRDNVVSLPARRQLLDDDAIVLKRLVEGDAVAFRRLMQKHLSAVVATARRIVRDEAEAEDIAQEAFLRLWRQAGTLEVGDYGLRPWLRRVASNLAIDGLRKSNRYDVTDNVPEQPEAPKQVEALEAAEASARVREALLSLPQRQRIAVSLFHFDELPQRDVAHMMQISEDALESLLARGRRKLRDLLKDDWQELLGNENV